WKVTEDRVDHRVAHEMHAPGIDSFAEEVLHRALTVREEESARMVRETSVRLFRHRFVEAPQPGLDVRDGDLQPRRRKGSGQRRVDVARDDDQRRLVLDEYALDADESLRDLFGVRSRSRSEEHVWLRHLELVDEDGGHR